MRVEDPSISGMHIFLVMLKAFEAMGAIDRASIAKLGLGSHSDFVLLEILLHKGAMPINAIGKKIGLTSGSITTAVDRAERRGYIVRNYDTQDRRVVFASLTAEGRKVIQEKMPLHAAVLEGAVGGLDSDERLLLVTLLKKMGYYARNHHESILQSTPR